jgi:hypothetical protein
MVLASKNRNVNLNFNAVFELPYKNTILSIQRDALRLKITDDIVIKM